MTCQFFQNFIYILFYLFIFLLLFYLLPSMGNSQTNSQKLHHRKLSRINHHILECASEIINKDSTELQLVIATPNQMQAKQWEQKINEYRIPNLQSQVLFLPKSVRYEGAALCGSGGIIKAIYSSPPLLLSEQLENRMAILQPFFQSEIWYLLYVLVYAASEVHFKELIIGDIRPKNIFLFETGEISITCLASFLEETPNYIKSFRNRQLTFLAPQQIDDLINHKTLNKDPKISENFSIGLTLLSLMLLHDEQKLYFSSQSIFDVEKFSKELACLANCQIYSVELKKIVLSLLHAQMDLRINSYQVFEILKPHQKRILNFDDFDLNMNNLNQQTKSKLNCIKFSDFRLGSSSTIVRCINEYERLDGRLSRLRSQNEEKDKKKELNLNNDQRVMNISNISKKLSSLMIVPGIQDHLFTPQNYKSEYNLNETKKQEILLKEKYEINEGDSEYNESDFIQKTQNNYMMNKFFKNQNRGSKSVSSLNKQDLEANNIETKSNLDKNNKNKNVIKEESSNINDSGEYYKPQAIKPQYVYTFSKNQDNVLQTFEKTSIPLQRSQQKTLGQTNQTDNRSENMVKDLKRLQQMGREAKSIKNMSKYTKKSNKKIDYESILKNIDEQLKCSRQKFPNTDQE